MTNRLQDESSPYLLQHADNPVDWRPWGEEALEKAKREDRPILLSIGYSACHWCHVMEKESFSDPNVAEIMNRAFVNIKVDREERPDIDSIYMRAVQTMTGQGGWPLTAFLTPDGAPFHGGTYYPPTPRPGMPSFSQLLLATEDAWRHRREEAVRVGARVRAILAKSQLARGEEAANDKAESAISSLVRYAQRNFDPTHGGFGGAPKFPQAPFLDALLHTGGDREAQGVRMAAHTLGQMARGGIRDHVGGGFHRYSVDARWLVPHFEKMLSDNALLASCHVRAHVLGVPGAGDVAAETLEYLLGDFASPRGGFYSARDADSEGAEGRFYIWTPAETKDALGDEDGDLFNEVYDISDSGNFEGRNIPHLPHGLEALARRRGCSADDLRLRLRGLLNTLRRRRAERPAPFLDKKVLTCWNGYAVRAFAEAGPALREPHFTAAAASALDALLDSAAKGDRIMRVRTGARVYREGFLEDYASLGIACLSVYEATLDPRRLQRAEMIADAALARFKARREPVFYDAPESSSLVPRPRETMDNAAPSGSSLMIELLTWAGRLAGREDFLELAGQALDRERSAMNAHPLAFGRLQRARLQFEADPLEIAISGPRPGIQSLIDRAHAVPHPNRLIRRARESEGPQAAAPGKRAGEATAVVCAGSVCHPPVHTADELSRICDREPFVTF